MPKPYSRKSEFVSVPLATVVAVLLTAAIPGCQTSSPKPAPVTLIDRSPVPRGLPRSEASYESVFRAFHQTSFPEGKWKVDDGILKSVAGPGVDLITAEKYAEYDLELEWNATQGANSGILYGVSEATSETYWSGPEYQINDDANHDDGKTPKYSAGALYDLMAPNGRKRLKPAGAWNHARIVCRNGHVEHWLNGAKILEYDWHGPAARSLIAQSKFSSEPRFMKEINGHFALQHHGAEVWFRNIRITRF